MKKSYLLLSLPIFSMLFACTNNEQNIVESNENLCIMCVNDSHGDMLRDPDSDANGYDGISTAIKNAQQDKENKDPIFICTGDMFQGQYLSNTTRGACVIDSLNYLNLDAFVIGNHEFDWGLDYIAKFKDGDLSNGELNCDFLGANIIQKSLNKRPDWIKPYTIIEKHGHKVGLIGFMGPDLEGSILAENVKDYEFTDIMPLYNEYSEYLVTEEKCDLIVVGIHDCDEGYLQLAHQKYPASAIFAGHTHKKELYTTSVSYESNLLEVPIIQGQCNNNMISKVNFTFENNKLSDIKADFIYNNCSSADLDYKLRNMIETKYESEIRAGNEVLSNDFNHVGRGAWRNIVADTLVGPLSEGANRGVINNGGIRYGSSYANSRTLYLKQLFRILPFDNKIYQVEINKSIFDRYSSNDRYYTFSRNDMIDTGDKYIVNVIDFVFTGIYNREVWDNAKVIKILNLNIREFVAATIKGQN